MTTQTQTTIEGYNPFVVATTELCSERAFLFYRQVFLDVTYSMDAQLKLFAHWLWALACQMVLSSGQMALHAGRKARGSCSSLAKVFWPKGYGYLSQLVREVQIFLAQAVSDQTSAPLSEESDGGLDPSVDQPQEEGTQGSANPLDMTVAELQALGVSELRSIAAASNVRVPGVRPSKTTKPQLLKQLEPLARVS